MTEAPFLHMYRDCQATRPHEGPARSGWRAPGRPAYGTYGRMSIHLTAFGNTARETATCTTSRTVCPFRGQSSSDKR